MSRTTTPLQAQAMILRGLRDSYPRRQWPKIMKARWLVNNHHVIVVTRTSFEVSDARHPQSNGDADPMMLVVDIVAGTCTCEDDETCEHLLAATIYAQVSAVDAAWRATHENVCRKRWCTGGFMAWRDPLKLCWRHGHELRRLLEMEDLRVFRAQREEAARL